MIYSIGSFEMLGDPGFGCWFRSWLDSQMPVQMHQTISLQRRVNWTKKGGGYSDCNLQQLATKNANEVLRTTRDSWNQHSHRKNHTSWKKWHFHFEMAEIFTSFSRVFGRNLFPASNGLLRFEPWGWNPSSELVCLMAVHVGSGDSIINSAATDCERYMSIVVVKLSQLWWFEIIDLAA